MASEIRVGGVKYQLAGTSEQGNVYVIQTATPEPETTIQTTTGEVRLWLLKWKIACQTFKFQYIINDIGDIGDEQIIMFEEAGGVGAEEVVSSNEYDLCFVDTAEVSSCRHCQQIEIVVNL